MKRLLLLAFVLSACSSGRVSCINKSDFRNIEWVPASSSMSYFVCKDGDAQMSRTDSLTITFCGTLNKEHKLANGAFDSLLFFSVYGTADGTFSMSSEKLNPTLVNTILQLKKNAVIYMRYSIGDSVFANPAPDIVLSFKSDFDSTAAAAWIQQTQATFTEIDRIVYISKEKAKELYLKEGNEDWSKILDSNPLPSTAEIFFVRNMPPGTSDRLANTFSEDPVVANVRSRRANTFTAAGSILQVPFIVRVVTH